MSFPPFWGVFLKNLTFPESATRETSFSPEVTSGPRTPSPDAKLMSVLTDNSFTVIPHPFHSGWKGGNLPGELNKKVTVCIELAINKLYYIKYITRVLCNIKATNLVYSNNYLGILTVMSWTCNYVCESTQTRICV